MTADEERQQLENHLAALEAELDEAIRSNRDNDELEVLHEQIFRVRAAFNRGCN